MEVADVILFVIILSSTFNVLVNNVLKLPSTPLMSFALISPCAIIFPPAITSPPDCNIAPPIPLEAVIPPFVT